ncbi:MAG: MaoC family dehydratase [Ahrensia sp.]|nr:MaoC family dehydratase [Ahrensia sp.]
MSGSQSFFDLVEVGMTQETGSHTFGAEEIVEFAREFDPQPFHLTQEAAEKSHFGSLCASGWHTIAAWMNLNVRHGYRGLREQAGYSGDMPKLGASPGVRNIKWTHPVYVGDTITYRSTVTGKKHGKTKGWGLMTFRTEGFNQDGVKVLTMDGAARMRMEE